MLSNLQLINSMEQNPSREVTSASVGQEIPPHFMEPEGSHFRIHSDMPLVPILSQMNPENILSSSVSSIDGNSTQLPKQTSCKYSVSFSFIPLSSVPASSSVLHIILISTLH
jgi:hypothetical protein